MSNRLLTWLEQQAADGKLDAYIYQGVDWIGLGGNTQLLTIQETDNTISILEQVVHIHYKGVSTNKASKGKIEDKKIYLYIPHGLDALALADSFISTHNIQHVITKEKF